MSGSVVGNEIVGFCEVTDTVTTFIHFTLHPPPSPYPVHSRCCKQIKVPPKYFSQGACRCCCFWSKFLRLSALQLRGHSDLVMIRGRKAEIERDSESEWVRERCRLSRPRNKATPTDLKEFQTQDSEDRDREGKRKTGRVTTLRCQKDLLWMLKKGNTKQQTTITSSNWVMLFLRCSICLRYVISFVIDRYCLEGVMRCIRGPIGASWRIKGKNVHPRRVQVLFLQQQQQQESWD